MKESRLKSEIVKLLRLYNIFAWINRNVGVYDVRRGRWIPSTVRGVPDIIGCLPDGRMLAIEVKSERGRLTMWQEIFLEELRQRGAVVIVARSLDDVVNVLKNLR